MNSAAPTILGSQVQIPMPAVKAFKIYIQILYYNFSLCREKDENKHSAVSIRLARFNTIDYFIAT